MSPTTKTPAPDGLRLTMADPPAPGVRTTSDGTWSPRSSDLLEELPPLLEEMQRRGMPVTRVSFPAAEWDDAARKVQLAGGLVRLGAFRSMAEHTVRLTSTGDRSLVLDVVPPQRSPARPADRS